MFDSSIVGTLDVGHSVDPNGSLSLDIPINVPPAKLSPGISVSYHSAVTEMSVLGLGWELHAYGFIQRTSATIDQDGIAGAINYDSNDKYSINGQRLILISGNEYRYEIDQWSKIVASGSNPANPDYWTEYLPDGTVRQYGSTSDSNLKAVGHSATRIWALAETNDTFSNYTSYSYTPADGTGFLTLDSISYGGNRNLSLLHQRKITFSYESRDDVRTEFVGGFPVTLRKRLGSISSRFNKTLFHTHVFDYGDGYSPVTGVSRLKTVTLRDDVNGSSVLPLKFDWSNCATSVFDGSVPLNPLPMHISNMQVLPVSVSGSGRTDLVIASKKLDVFNLDVYLADGKGNVSTTPQPGSGPIKGLKYPHQLLALDVNGDGKTDLLHIWKNVAGRKHVVTTLLLKPEGYVPQTPFTFEPPVMDGAYYTGDFQGNGNVGLVYVYKTVATSTFSLVQFINDGKSFSPQKPVSGPHAQDVQVVIGDFDGNGAEDIFFMSQVYSGVTGDDRFWRIDFFKSEKGQLLFKSDPFDSVRAKIKWAQHSAFLALPEPDGKTGLLLVSQDMNTHLQYQTLRSTGKSLNISSVTSTSLLYSGNINVGHTTSTTSLDLVNIFHSVSDNKTKASVLHFSKGVFKELQEVKQPSSFHGYDVHFVDLRGVGRADCLFSRYNSVSKKIELSSLPCADTVAPADYITGYTNGLGATLSVTYASLTDSTVYTTSTPDTGPANPYVNALSRTSSSSLMINPSTSNAASNATGSTRTQLIRFPKYVVKQLTSCALPSEQPDIVSTSEYLYKNARIGFGGRGWLGFESITQKSAVLRTKTINTYKQEFPFIGQMSKTETQDNSNPDHPLTLKSTIYSWKSHPTGHSTQCYTTMPSIQEVSFEKEVRSYSVDVAHDYDSYGNMTRTKVTTAGKPDVVISQTYDNDTDKWIIGSKLSESITSNGSLMKRTNFSYLTGTQVVNQITKWISESSSIVENLSFDKAGNVTKSAGPWRAEKTFSYDQTYSFPVKVTSAINDESSLTTSATYDYAVGNVASSTDYNGHVMAHQYDVLGRVVHTSEGESLDKMTVIQKQEYTILDGHAVCVHNTLCDLASQSWSREIEYLDGLERTWKKAAQSVSDSSETVYSQVTLDGAGRIVQEYRNYTSKSTPVYAKYTYDALSRKTGAIFPPILPGTSAITITWEYGPTTITQTQSGDATTTTKTVLEYFPNPETGSHRYVVPLSVSSVDELGQAVTTTFDALHREVSIRDPTGVTVFQEWDYISRMTGRKVSNSGAIKPINQFSISYDDNTGAKTITNQCTGSKIVFTQDRLYRLTERTADVHDKTTYTYDDVHAGGMGRLSSVLSSTGVLEAFSYDPRGCMRTSSLTIDNKTFTTSFEYTTSYELSKIVNPDKSILTKTFFDKSGIVKQVQLQDANSKTSVSCTFSNFDNGFQSPQHCELGNGLTSTVELAGNGVPRKAIVSKGGTTRLQQTWTLDSHSRLKAYNPSPSDDTNRVFEYNAGGQLIRSQSAHKPAMEYKYDGSGNISYKNGQSFSTEGWQLRSIGDTSSNVISSFEYTADGHLAKEINAGGTVRTITYDSLGRTTAINSTKFVYDSKGRMVKAATGDSVTYYPTTSYEATIEGNTTKHTAYLLHPNRRASISTVESSEPSVHYYHVDHLGSVIAVSDKNGEVVTRYSYDDYGVAIVESGTDISRYKYSEKEVFEGLYYFGARFYDPERGRFTTLDKVACSLQSITASIFNQYTFSRNDPVNYIDWNGNMSFWWHLAWHLAVDVALTATGVVAEIFLPEVPMLGQSLIGAGIGGLQYDGVAAFDAVVFNEKHLDDAEWGRDIAIGAVMGMVEGAGAFEYAGKAAGKVAGKVGGKVWSKVPRTLIKGPKTLLRKVGIGRLKGGYSAKELGVESSRASRFAKGVLKQTSSVTKASAWPILKNTSTSVGIRLEENIRTGKNPTEGLVQATFDGIVGGAIGAGATGITRGMKVKVKAVELRNQRAVEDSAFDADEVKSSLLVGESLFYV